MKPKLTLLTTLLLAPLVTLLRLASSVSAEDGVDSRDPEFSIKAEDAAATLP